jgi:hypothetical protein
MNCPYGFQRALKDINRDRIGEVSFRRDVAGNVSTNVDREYLLADMHTHDSSPAAYRSGLFAAGYTAVDCPSLRLRKRRRRSADPAATLFADATILNTKLPRGRAFPRADLSWLCRTT